MQTTIKSFEEFLGETHDILAGNPATAAKTHMAVIRTNGGAVHHHSEKDGIHTVVHSSKGGAMKVSEIHPSSDKNNSSIIITRRANDKEKNRYSGKLIVSEK